jgi:Zn-dependent M28 family amino/carboxypeptidase
VSLHQDRKRSSSAVTGTLVSAVQVIPCSQHFPNTLGASDDGISVVTLLEVLNTLVHNETWIRELKSDVIFMWNGGEELGRVLVVFY